MQGLRDLERAVKDYGFVGAHLYPHWFGLAPDHAKYYPYYAKCCELDIPIMMQVGHNLIYSRDRRLPSVGRPICLDQVAIDFPELKLLGIHIGIPWTDEMISMAWKHENVFIGVDAYAPKHWPQQLVHYLDTYGRHKVLFGTDWPVIDPERAVSEIAALKLRPDSQAMLMRDNALRVFRLPESRRRQARNEESSPIDGAREPIRPNSPGPIARSPSMPASAPPSIAPPTSSRCAKRERTLTYRQLISRINRVSSAAIGDLGLRLGDRAAILAGNCLEYIEIMCGLSGVGVAVATPSPRLTAAEVKLICDDCGARVLFVEHALEDMVRAISFVSIERIIIIGGDYENWMAKGRDAAPDIVIDEWQPFSIPYTSGTTGQPKGVTLPHRARTLIFYAMAVEYGCYSPDDRALGVAPLCHGAGFAFAMAPVYFGGYCEIIRKFEPDRILGQLNSASATNIFLVPTHFHAIFGLEASACARYRRGTLAHHHLQRGTAAAVDQGEDRRLFRSRSAARNLRLDRKRNCLQSSSAGPVAQDQMRRPAVSEYRSARARRNRQ